MGTHQAPRDLGRRDAAGVLLRLPGVLLRLDLHRSPRRLLAAARAQPELLVRLGRARARGPVAVAPLSDRARDVEAVDPRRTSPASFLATLTHAVLAVSGRRVLVAWMADGMPPGGESTWLMDFQRMFFLNFDWEMMTYWAHRGPQPRAALSRRSAGPRPCARASSKRSSSRRSSRPAASAAAALPLQHAQHDLRADAPRRRGGRPHDRAARAICCASRCRTSACRRSRSSRSSISWRSTSRSNKRASGIVSPWCSTSHPDALDALVPEPHACSRSSRTPSSTASGRGRVRGSVAHSAHGATAIASSSRCATTASACRRRACRTSIAASGSPTRARGCSTSTAPTIASSSGSPPGGGLSVLSRFRYGRRGTSEVRCDGSGRVEGVA